MKYIIIFVISICSLIAYLNSKPSLIEKEINIDFQSSKQLEDLLSISEKLGNNITQLKSCLSQNKLCGKWKSYGDILLTGYYEPELNGSLTPDNTFKYPLYAKPDDLVEVSGFTQLKQKLFGRFSGNKVIPYYTREEISKGALADKKLELVWTDDPIENFLLHIQGSGRIKLKDGNLFIGYAAKNGQPYRPIGKYLLDNKKLEKGNINLQTIEEYLRAHPEEQKAVFNSDPSFVFFRKSTQAATGSSGIVLPPMLSVASDPEFYPKGSICLLEFKLPKEFDPNQTPQKLLVANLDTGGAIKGEKRMDLFTGFGKDARRLAGYMKQTAKVFCLF